MFTSFSFAPIKAEAAETVTASGFCGSADNIQSVRWEIKGDTLYVTGEGKVEGALTQTIVYNSGYGWKKWELYKDDIKKVIVGEGITAIGIESFAGMGRLESVTLPKSLVTIENRAFLDDNSIKEVNIAKGSLLKTIKGEAFIYNDEESVKVWFSALKDLENLECIETFCVSPGETLLTEDNGLYFFNKILYDGKEYEGSKVVVKEGTLGIANEAFECNSCIEEVELPSSIKYIDSNAFRSCGNLLTVSANGAKLDYVNSYAFADTPWEVAQLTNDYVQLNNVLVCFSGKETVSVGSDIDIISEYAFAEDASLKNISFASDSKVKSIPVGAFCYCTNLESVTLPNSLEIINTAAFCNCGKLESIKIPDSVKTIQSEAFDECHNLYEVTGGKNVTVCEKDAFSSTFYASLTAIANEVKLGKCLIAALYYYPEGGKVTLPEDCCCISGNIVCDGVSEFVVPESYTQIYSNIKFRDIDTKLPSGTNPDITLPCTLSFFPDDIEIDVCFEKFGFHCAEGSVADYYARIIKDSKYWLDCDISYDISHADAPVKKNVVEATCTKDGSYDEVICCKYCGLEKSSEHKTIKATGHKEEKNIKAATTKKDGKLTVTCSKCKETLKEEVIPRAYVTVEDTAKYTGKTVKQPVKVTDKNGKTISKDNYSISYKNNKKVGKATVTVKFKGNYSGTSKNTFVITKKADIPSAVKSLKLKAAKKAINVSWKPLTKKCTGYEIQYSTDKKFLSSDTKVKKITKAATKTLKLSKLSSGKKYYVRMRATAKDSKKNTVHSSWSKVVTVTVK